MPHGRIGVAGQDPRFESPISTRCTIRRLRSAFDELSLGHIPTSLSRSTGRRVPQMGGLHVQLMGDIVELLVIGMQEWEMRNAKSSPRSGSDAGNQLRWNKFQHGGAGL